MNSRPWRELLARYKRRAGSALLHSPLHRLFRLLPFTPDPVREYRRWLEKRHSAAPPGGEFLRLGRDWTYQPRFSVLMATYNPRPEWLQAAIESVRGQIYPNWELCVVDDSSFDPSVLQQLETAARDCERIRVRAFRCNRGISGALNAARELATGEYLSFLDHDDLLAPDALYRFVEAIQQDRADLLYSDEDYVDAAGRPVFPQFKPGWSPQLLDCCMYMGHLLAVRAEVFDAAGGFRPECDGAQDYDLALRVCELASAIRHVPRILYHWRQHSGSTAASTAAKPYTHQRGKLALQDALRRRGLSAVIEDRGAPNEYSVRSQTLPGQDQVLVSRIPGLDALTPDWLERLSAHLSDPSVAAAGAKILDPHGLIEHAGLTLAADGRLIATGRGFYRLPNWKWVHFTRNVSAVAGCIVISSAWRRRLGEFSSELNAIESQAGFCVRAAHAGAQIVFDNEVVFRSRAPLFAGELRIPAASAPDPFYHPCLELTEAARLL